MVEQDFLLDHFCQFTRKLRKKPRFALLRVVVWTKSRLKNAQLQLSIATRGCRIGSICYFIPKKVPIVDPWDIHANFLFSSTGKPSTKSFSTTLIQTLWILQLWVQHNWVLKRIKFLFSKDKHYSLSYGYKIWPISLHGRNCHQR